MSLESEPNDDLRTSDTTVSMVATAEAPSRIPNSVKFLTVAVLAAAAFFGVKYVSRNNSALQKLPMVNPNGVHEHVLKILNKARGNVVENPDSSIAWGNYGFLLFAHELERESIDCFVEAERLDASAYQWPYMCGMGMSLNGLDPATTSAFFERALFLRPNDPSMRITVGEYYMGLNRFDEAATQWQYILRYEPSHAWALFGMARIAFYQDKIDEAIDLAKRSVQADKSLRKAHELLTQLYFRQGDEEVARKELATVESLPDDLPVDSLLEQVVSLRQDPAFSVVRAKKDIGEGKFQAAIERLEPLIGYENHPMGFYNFLAMAHMRTQNFQRAAEVLELGTKKQPNSSELRRTYSNVYLAQGNRAAAIEQLKLGLKVKPDSALIYHELGHCYADQSKNGEAIEAWKRAVSIRPDSSATHFAMAKLFHELNRIEDAKRHLRHALKAIPNMREASDLLKRLEAQKAL